MLSEHGAAQLHAAETEKYAHVTYFFNGGVEEAWAGEERIVVPSPRDVAELRPEAGDVGAPSVADRFCAEIGTATPSCVVNFANPDMVGHTGVDPGRRQAVETTDRCLGRIVDR